MTLLLGQETTPTEFNRTENTGVIYAWQTTALRSGTVKFLHAKFNQGLSNAIALLGVYADNGANRPGTLLGQAKSGKLPIGISTVEVQVSLVTQLVEGQKYWLAMAAFLKEGEPTEGGVALHPVGENTSTGQLTVKSTANTFKLALGETSSWAESKQGPLIWWAEGFEPVVTLDPRPGLVKPRTGVSLVSESWLNATQVKGVDPTGTTDSTTGLQSALQSAATEKRTLFIPEGSYKVGEEGTGWDFSKVKWGTGASGAHRDVLCDAGTIITGHPNLKTNPVVNVAPSPEMEQQFIGCRFNFGVVSAAAGLKEGPCIVLKNVNDSEIHVATVGSGSRGLLLVSSTAFFCANNIINITTANLNKVGIFLESENVQGPLSGVQANTFICGEIGANTEFGVAIDNAVGKNSRWNNFYIGTVDTNSGTAAITDNCGTNKFRIGVGTGNTVDYSWNKGASNKPGLVQGYLETGVTAETLEGGGIMLTNERFQPGYAPTQPNVPAKNETVVSKQERAAMVHIKLVGAGAEISIDGKATGLKEAGLYTVELWPGEKISLGNYEGGTAWQWFLI